MDCNDCFSNASQFSSQFHAEFENNDSTSKSKSVDSNMKINLLEKKKM